MKIFKSRTFAFILGAIIFGGIGVYAGGLINSSEVNYSPSNINWNVSNVKDALDNIYNELNSECDYNVGKVWSFAYTGNQQEFKVPCDGKYKIELWGAQGGNYNDSTTYIGGKGAYTSGTISLSGDTNLYVYVGGQPSSSSTSEGGYNGGGICTPNKDEDGRTGGGATDIRLTNGTWNSETSLASRIMVAAGGGGASFEGSSWNAAGGAGGGLTGLTSTVMGSNSRSYYGTGGTQTAGGTKTGSAVAKTIDSSIDVTGKFGIGGGGSSMDGGAGGGGGYYGGGGTAYLSGGGGGSSYISGYTGCVAITAENNLAPKTGCSDGTTDISCSYHYSGKIFTDTIMKSGNESMPTHDGSYIMTGNIGNGFAKITFISKN